MSETFFQRIGERYKQTWNYYILIVLIVFTALFFRGPIVNLPEYPLLLLFILLSYGWAQQSWNNWKMHGRVCVTTLGRENGGHSTYHPDDIRYASKKGRPSFMVMAQGGFDYSKVSLSVRGKDRFLVFPPEHCEEMNPGMVIHSKFWPIKLNQLPDYVQSELQQLEKFKEKVVDFKGNLLFGGTCQNFKIQDEDNVSNFLDQTQQLNSYKEKLKDAYSLGFIAPREKREDEEESD